jgi:hypothetical protein
LLLYAQSFEHQSLYRRWREIEEWLATSDLTADDAHRQALRRIIAIEADEPPENRPAVDLCDNEVLRAEGHDPAHRIGWLGRLAASL